MPKTVNLDDVLISPAAYAALHEIASRAAAAMSELGVPAEAIGIERARIEDDGSLTIFVEVSEGYGIEEVSMTVPPDHWSPRHEA